jgi:hypothetical protein
MQGSSPRGEFAGVEGNGQVAVVGDDVAEGFIVFFFAVF